MYAASIKYKFMHVYMLCIFDMARVNTLNKNIYILKWERDKFWFTCKFFSSVDAVTHTFHDSQDLALYVCCNHILTSTLSFSYVCRPHNKKWKSGRPCSWFVLIEYLLLHFPPTYPKKLWPKGGCPLQFLVKCGCRGFGRKRWRRDIKYDQTVHREYRVIPGHKNWQIEITVWNLASFLNPLAAI